MWWDAALRSLHTSGVDVGVTHIVKSQYVVIFRKVHRVTMRIWGEADAMETIEDDWSSDAKGADILTRELFMDAMFELADLWTAGTEPAEYASFLLALFSKVACYIPPDTYLWRDDAAIQYAGDDFFERFDGDTAGGGSDGEHSEGAAADTALPAAKKL
eukprot:3717920-Prymnesium_polylepis.1